MPGLQIRWSEAEATKPYARPLMVTFSDDDGSVSGSIAVSGADLLYYRQFQVAVMTLTGELFRDAGAESTADAQRAWLSRLAQLLPPAGPVRIDPVSSFDDSSGRAFRFEVHCDAPRHASVDASVVLEYQEFQAALAHQTGHLFRERGIEDIDDPASRHAAWTSFLRQRVERPDAAEAMSPTWPWR